MEPGFTTHAAPQRLTHRHIGLAKFYEQQIFINSISLSPGTKSGSNKTGRADQAGLPPQDPHNVCQAGPEPWRPSHPRWRTRTVWTPPASSIPPNTCPVCRQGFDRLRDLHIHYLHTHAITDPAITTFNVFQCGECRQTFPNAYARLNHECRILYEVPDHDIRDKYGWLPLQIPNIDPPHPSGKFIQMALFSHNNRPRQGGVSQFTTPRMFRIHPVYLKFTAQSS